jgi:hypothetical protein
MKKLILATLAFIAFVFVLGSVGAYDNGSIGFLRLILQVGIGVLVEWFTLSHLDA